MSHDHCSATFLPPLVPLIEFLNFPAPSHRKRLTHSRSVVSLRSRIPSSTHPRTSPDNFNGSTISAESSSPKSLLLWTTAILFFDKQLRDRQFMPNSRSIFAPSPVDSFIHAPMRTFFPETGSKKHRKMYRSYKKSLVS